MFVTLLSAMSAMAAPSHDIVQEDLFTLDSAGEMSVSRDGRYTALVRHRWHNDTGEAERELWLVDNRRRTSQPLTFGIGDVAQPGWSEDGLWIYFTSHDDQSEQRQVFRVHREHGTVQRLTSVEEGVKQVAYGESLWITTTHTSPVDDDWAHLRARHATPMYGAHEQSRASLLRVDLSTLRWEEVYSTDHHLMDFAPAPNERKVAMLVAPDADLVTHEGWSEVAILDVTDGSLVTLDDDQWREQAPSPYGWLLGLSWASDSRALSFRIDFDGHPGDTYVAELSGSEPAVWEVPLPDGMTAVGGAMEWVPGKRELCQLATHHARTRVVCTNGLRGASVGPHRAFPEGDVVVRRFAFSEDGRDVIASVGTPDRFTDVYRMPARGHLGPVQLTDLNPHTRDWKLPSLQLVQWTAPDGTQVEGLLELPYGYTEEQGPLPMIVHLHGGPTAHTRFARSFRAYGQTLFAARGYAVFSPNYRGSTGYGDTFITDLVGHENDVEVKDILAGVDAMVERGIANPDKLAVMGWSNGGYLTNALITTTDRFKAASSGAGVSEMTMQWALEDTPGHVINFMEGLPWDKPEDYIHSSPLHHAHKVSTPTLFHVGEFDERVPAAHARAFHRALSIYLGQQTELLVYPGMGHGLRKKEHLLAKMDWDHNWFDHWLELDQGDASPETVATREGE